jgi:RNA polymerase sigma-70 factor (ECF subfamily)
MAASSLPTREQEQELHRRLLEGDKTAIYDLADAYYDALLHYLRNTNAKRLSEELLADAASTTWLSLSKKPSAYDGKGSLWAYLQMSAQRDLINALAKETRHRQREKTSENVELLCGNGKSAGDEDETAERLARVEKVRHEILPSVQAGLTDGEASCLELYLGGERKTARYAAALGIADRAAAEQKRAVKKTKDKLIKRIERARRNHDNAP